MAEDLSLPELTPEVLKNPAVQKILNEMLTVDNELAKIRGLEDAVYLGREILGFKDLSDTFHKDIERQLNRPDTLGFPFDLILVPRGHLKTTFITITWVIQQILKNPDIRILITNAVQENAEQMLDEIKQCMRKPRFVELYGTLKGNVWHEKEINVRGRTRIDKTHTIEIGSPERTKTSQHYDIIVADDLVSRDNIKSVDGKYGMYLYWQDLIDLLETPGGRLITIGTRWDYDELYSILIDKKKNHHKYMKVYLRKVYETGEDGKEFVIFPQKFSWEKIKELKDNKDITQFSAQYMNEPQAPGDATFKEEYFKVWKVLPEYLYRFMMIDPAAAITKKADYTTILVIGVDEKDDWYLLDAVRDRFQPTELINAAWSKRVLWNPMIVGFETVGFQMYVKKDWDARQLSESNRAVRVREINPGLRPKQERVMALEPKLRAGKLFFPEEILYKNSLGQVIDLVWVLKNELLTYRYDVAGHHDDMKDNLAYFLDFAFKPQPVVTKSETIYEKVGGQETNRPLTGVSLEAAKAMERMKHTPKKEIEDIFQKEEYYDD